MVNRRELRKQLCEAIVALDTERVKEIAALDPTIVNAPTAHRNVPLGDAIGTDSLEMVKLMVELGADPHHRNHGGAGLMDGAAFGGHAAIARYLVSIGLDASVHHAAAMGDLDRLKALADADPRLLGPTPGRGRWILTPLHAAVMSRCAASVELLLSMDVNVDARDHNGMTALGRVDDRKGPDEAGCTIARLLLDRDADPNCSAGYHGGTLLHRAVINGNGELVRLLLEHGAAPNRQDWSGKTPLHHAVSKNRALVEILLDASPDPTITSKQDETPSDLARRLKKTSILRLLDGS